MLNGSGQLALVANILQMRLITIKFYINHGSLQWRSQGRGGGGLSPQRWTIFASFQQK